MGELTVLPSTHNYGTSMPLTQQIRTMGQTFVLTPAMKVAVDPSV
jgi:hypothetical protein